MNSKGCEKIRRRVEKYKKTKNVKGLIWVLQWYWYGSEADMYKQDAINALVETDTNAAERLIKVLHYAFSISFPNYLDAERSRIGYARVETSKYAQKNAWLLKALLAFGPSAIDTLVSKSNKYSKILLFSTLGLLFPDNNIFLKYCAQALNNNDKYIKLGAIIGISYADVKDMGVIDTVCTLAKERQWEEEKSKGLLSFMLTSPDDPCTDVGRITAINILSTLTDHQTSAVVFTLANDNTETIEIRLAAIQALGHMKCIAGVEFLIGALEDTDSKIREAAAVSLGRIGDPGAIPPLISLLKNRYKLEVRRAAIATLAYLNARSSIELLAGFLSDDALGNTAAIALARMGDARGIDKVIDNLVFMVRRLGPVGMALGIEKPEFPNQYICNVIDLLGNLGDPRAIKTLTLILNSGHRSNEFTRSASAEALGKILSKKGIDNRDKYSIKAIKELCRRTKYDKEMVRISAIMALGEIGDKETVKTFEKLSRANNEFVRKAACEALNKIRKKHESDSN